jgi:hypothetical protein
LKRLPWTVEIEVGPSHSSLADALAQYVLDRWGGLMGRLAKS